MTDDIRKIKRSATVDYLIKKSCYFSFVIWKYIALYKEVSKFGVLDNFAN